MHTHRRNFVCDDGDFTTEALKTQVLENASTENASTMQTFSQIKMFGTSQVSVVHFQVGWASGLQTGFFLR